MVLLANEVAKPVTDPVFWTLLVAALDGAAAGALDGATDEATWFVAAGALDGATDEAACCCLLICGAAELAAWFALVATEALLAAEAGLL